MAALFSRQIVFVFAPGLDAARLDHAAGLVALSLWLVPLTTLAGVSMAYLHAHGRFGTASLGTLIYNLAAVAGLEAKLLAALAVDGLILSFALWSAYALRLGVWDPDLREGWWLPFVAPVIALPILAALGFYRTVIRYFDASSVRTAVMGITIATLTLMGLVLLTRLPWVPRSVFIIYWGVAILGLLGVRWLARYLLTGGRVLGTNQEAVAIYGAGAAGCQLAAALKQGGRLRPVLFLDDARILQRREIMGLRVHPPAELPELIRRYMLTRVLLAIPSVPRRRQRQILEFLEPLAIKVMVMPGLGELAEGRKRVDELREIEIEDLLGREPVAPDPQLLQACIRGKNVMVTGAGGSIGAELCRQILALGPRRLVLLELSELALYSIERELHALAGDASGVEIVPLLGSVQDAARVETALQAWAIHTVYHAAAYKHVPLVEYNPVEGLRNNALGTLQTARAARAAGVETFVLVSTDKAVRPTNVMGASKRLAEMVLQALADQPGPTRYCMVRFGNVLASSGSVVPLFREQIRRGGPVTVTHPEMVRYFMSIPEAAQLVIQAGSMSRGGEVFVLDMGEPVRIVHLAERMIHLSGLSLRDARNPDGDIGIVFTGLRPGEKLYEELLISETDRPTIHPRIRCAQEEFLPWDRLEPELQALMQALERQDRPALQALLRRLVHGYEPESRVTGEVPAAGAAAG